MEEEEDRIEVESSCCCFQGEVVPQAFLNGDGLYASAVHNTSDQEPHPAGLCNQGKLFRSDLKCTSNICVSSVSVSRAMVCVNDLKGHPPTLRGDEKVKL